MAKDLTTTETMGRGEVDQPKVGPEGVRLAGASESKDTESTELDGIYRWVERRHPDGFIDSLGYLQNIDRCYERLYARLDSAEHQRDEWREIAARLALACIADGGDFREEVLSDYRKMLEEAGE